MNNALDKLGDEVTNLIRERLKLIFEGVTIEELTVVMKMKSDEAVGYGALNCVGNVKELCEGFLAEIAEDNVVYVKRKGR